ncbi:hypothetical protein E8E11_008075 [Didymella keratinophila]|nr:hypothetical protein E8E11_008075 [Didymella keratinophila]
MDQTGKTVRVARDEYPDFPGLLGDRPMSVIQTPWNSRLIGYWTYDESYGYRLRDEEIPGTDHHFENMRTTHDYHQQGRPCKFWGPDGSPPITSGYAALCYNSEHARELPPNASDVIMPSISAPWTRPQWDKGFVTDYRPWAAPFAPRRDSASATDAAKQAESTASYPPQRAANASYTASNPAISQQQDYTAPATLFELVQSSSEDSADGVRRRAAGLQTELDDLNYKIAELDLERKRHIKEYQRFGRQGKNLRNRRKKLEKQLDALVSTEPPVAMEFR